MFAVIRHYHFDKKDSANWNPLAFRTIGTNSSLMARSIALTAPVGGWRRSRDVSDADAQSLLLRRTRSVVRPSPSGRWLKLTGSREWHSADRTPAR